MSVTVGTAPRIALMGPPPVAPAFNFFTVALDLDDPDVRESMDMGFVERWKAGVTVWPRPTDKPFGFDYCAEPGTMREKEEGTPFEDEFPVFLPFSAYVPEACTGMSREDFEVFKERANSMVLASLAYAAERQFAHGQPIGDNPSLNDTNLIMLASNVGPIEGLAQLENAIGQTGIAGVIHATPAIATMWSANRSLLWTGDVIRTVATRTPVIVGHGYIGTDPDAAPGPSGDVEYAFATGPVFAGRGELEELSGDIAETLDRSNNDLVYRAEVELLVGWDCSLQVGVSIDRSSTP